MPSMNVRMATVDNMKGYDIVDTPNNLSVPQSPLNNNPTSLQMTSTNSNLMSINQGNSVPMRGILPIEQMSDCDLYRFYPYTAHMDRIPKYTYYQLANNAS